MHVRLGDVEVLAVIDANVGGLADQDHLRVAVHLHPLLLVGLDEGGLHQLVVLIVLPVRLVEIRVRGEQLIVPVARIREVGSPDSEMGVVGLCLAGAAPLDVCARLQRLELDIDPKVLLPLLLEILCDQRQWRRGP